MMLLLVFLGTWIGVILQVIGLRSENICWLHCTTFLWTKHTVYHKSFFKTKYVTVIAKPISFWKLLYSIAALMDWNIAVSTENYQVLIFIVTAITDHALCIFLSNKCPFMHTHILIFLFFNQDLLFSSFSIFNLFKYFLILDVVLSLLYLFNVLQKFLLLF